MPVFEFIGDFARVFSGFCLGFEFFPNVQKISLNSPYCWCCPALKQKFQICTTISSFSYAFNLAASDELMDAKEAGVVYDRIEDAIVQADEVDGKMLQVSNHPTQIISPLCTFS